MTLLRPLWLLDALGLQHPRTRYYRRPEIVDAIEMGIGTRLGIVIILTLLIIGLIVVAAMSMGVIAYSVYGIFSDTPS